MKNNNPIVLKSKAFAVRTVKLCRYLRDRKDDYILSKQLLRSGTSIGANVKEAVFAQSKADFIAKMSIALKECSETEYWIELLHETGYITVRQFNSIHADATELLRLLTAILKSARAKKKL